MQLRIENKQAKLLISRYFGITFTYYAIKIKNVYFKLHCLNSLSHYLTVF